MSARDDLAEMHRSGMLMRARFEHGAVVYEDYAEIQQRALAEEREEKARREAAAAEETRRQRARAEALESLAAPHPRVKTDPRFTKAMDALRAPGFFDASNERFIEGIATAPGRLEGRSSSVDPMGAEYTLPLPLLLKHDWNAVIGRVVWAERGPEALKFRAQIANTKAADDVWQRVCTGQLPAVSINSFEADSSAHYHSPRWEWSELSVCEIGANPSARTLYAEDRLTRGGETFTRVLRNLRDKAL